LLQPVRFQKAAKLAGKNCRLSREIVIKEIRNLSVQEDHGSSGLPTNYQWHCHEGAPTEFGNQKGPIGIEVVLVHRLAASYGLEHYLVVGFWPKSPEAVREQAIRLGGL
jgi:hypothetical protein